MIANNKRPRLGAVLVVIVWAGFLVSYLTLMHVFHIAVRLNGSHFDTI